MRFRTDPGAMGPDADEPEGADDAADDKAKTDLHSGALDRFHVICLAQQEERAVSLQDRRFVSIAGAQWEGAWATQFANSIMVEVNKTAMGCEKISDDYKANRVTVEFRARSEDPAEQEAAETLNGLFMADVYASKGSEAFDNAFEEGMQGGMGAWRLRNKYVDEYDPDDDKQCIAFEMIPDADQSVFWDMSARLYDKSDAKFCFVVTAMPRAEYEDTYGDDPDSWPQDILKPYYDWYTVDVVRVADYYRVVETTQVRISFKNAATDEPRKVWLKDLAPGELADMKTEGWRETGRRKVKRRVVEKYTLSGGQIIEDLQVIAGNQIPVVPYYGKRWFIDNMERVRGHVRLAKDPQRIYNAQISKLTETTAITPIERPIFTPEQVAGHEQSWAEANLNRSPYSLVNAIIGIDGNPMPAGPLATLSPPQMPPVLSALIQITANDINELTTNAQNADEVKSNVSPEAMDIAATRIDAKSFTYMDNFRKSMQRCGEIYEGMAGEVYVEEGRKVPLMDEDGKHTSATLLESSMTDKGVLYLSNDFAKLKFNVISDVTEATSTRRDKTVKSLVATAQVLAPFDPQGAAACIGVAVLNMEGEGVDDLKDWMRGRLVQQGVVKPTDQEKEQMAQAAAQQGQGQPSPQAQVLQAQTQKEQALTVKAQADTELSKAQAIKYLADAHKAHTDAAAAPADQAQQAEAHRVATLGKLQKFFLDQAQAGAGQ